MRWLRSASLALGAMLGAGVSVEACSAKHDPAPGEILLAIDANLNVPSDMDQLGVSVMAQDGTVASIDQVYPMSPIGDAKLPATLAIVRGTSGPIDIKVAGFKAGEAFVLRETVTTIPADRTAILRVDLNWLDTGSTSGSGTQVQALTTAMPCVAGQTSVAGTCEPFTLDSATLPTYTNGSLVSSTDTATDAGPQCLDIVDCVVGQPGATRPPESVQPSMMSIPAPDGGVSPTCVIAPPSTFTGDFNIGMIPKSGAAGWCNGVQCALPLENDVAPNWPVASDGMVHLPLGVCTSQNIAGLLLSPVTPGCPQYGATLHPACQEYGRDGGTTFSGDGGVRRNDGGGGNGEGGAGTMFLGFNHDGLFGGGYDTVLGLALDPTNSSTTNDVVYALRTGADGGTAFTSEPFESSPFFRAVAGGYQAPATFSAQATSAAAAADRVAVASTSGVNVFFLDGGIAGGYAATATAPVTIGFDQQEVLVAAGFSNGLMWLAPDGGSGTGPTYANGVPTLLAFNDSSNSFVVVSEESGGDKLRSLSYDPIPTGLPPAFATAQTVNGNGIVAVTVAEPNTVVWVDSGGNFFASPIGTADGGAGTQLPVTKQLYNNGVKSLAGGGGVVAWITNDQHVWAMRVMNGAAAGTATDLSTITEQTTGPAFLTASTVAVAASADILHWTQSDGTVYATRLSLLP